MRGFNYRKKRTNLTEWPVCFGAPPNVFWKAIEEWEGYLRSLYQDFTFPIQNTLYSIPKWIRLRIYRRSSSMTKRIHLMCSTVWAVEGPLEQSWSSMVISPFPKRENHLQTCIFPTACFLYAVCTISTVSTAFSSLGSRPLILRIVRHSNIRNVDHPRKPFALITSKAFILFSSLIHAHQVN